MDTQYVAGPGLVYHQPSPFFDHQPRPFPLVHQGQQAMSWPEQAHTSPPNSSASTSSSLSGTSLYSTVPQSTDNVDYPSASAHLTQPRSVNDHRPGAVDESSGADAPFASPQIASSVGPARYTRRRARTTVQAPSRSYNVCISRLLSYFSTNTGLSLTHSGVRILWPSLVRALARPLPSVTLPLRRL